MLASHRKIYAAVVLAVALATLSIATTAQAKRVRAGSYAGKIRPTDASDSSSNTKIRFKVARSGRKITKLKATFYYGCWIGGIFSLQYYVFPSVHKGPIKIRRNGAFSAKDVIDKEAGFVVRFSGKFRSSSRAKGKISLQTTTTGSGCGRKFTWSAKRK